MSVQSLHSSHPASGFHLFDAEPGQFASGYQDSLSCVLWAGQANAAALGRIRALSRHMAVSHPEGHLNVTFIAAGAPMPAEDAREGFTRVFDGKLTGVLAMGIVLEGEGFWAGALRGAITNFRQANEPPSQTTAVHVGSSMEAATDWLSDQFVSQMNTHIGPGRLLHMLTEARQALTAAATP